MFVEIAEEFEMTAVGCVWLVILVQPLPARDPFIDQFRDGGVAANYDEHGRHGNSSAPPFVVH